jgi:hypothetical protein
MFCDRCGTSLRGTEAFCATCGKPIHAAPPPPLRTIGRVEGHVRNLGYFWLIYSMLRMAGGWMAGRFFTHWGIFWNPTFPGVFPHILRGVGMILMATGILGILAGWGLLERQPWARTLAIVLGVLSLFHIGIGTVLGIYTLWVLLPAASAIEYQRTARV